MNGDDVEEENQERPHAGKPAAADAADQGALHVPPLLTSNALKTLTEAGRPPLQLLDFAPVTKNMCTLSHKNAQSFCILIN